MHQSQELLVRIEKIFYIGTITEAEHPITIINERRWRNDADQQLVKQDLIYISTDSQVSNMTTDF